MSGCEINAKRNRRQPAAWRSASDYLSSGHFCPRAFFFEISTGDSARAAFSRSSPERSRCKGATELYRKTENRRLVVDLSQASRGGITPGIRPAVVVGRSAFKGRAIEERSAEDCPSALCYDGFASGRAVSQTPISHHGATGRLPASVGSCGATPGTATQRLGCVAVELAVDSTPRAGVRQGGRALPCRADLQRCGRFGGAGFDQETRVRASPGNDVQVADFEWSRLWICRIFRDAPPCRAGKRGNRRIAFQGAAPKRLPITSRTLNALRVVYPERGKSGPSNFGTSG